MSLAGLPDFKTEQASTVGLPKILQKKWSGEGRLDSETAKINNNGNGNNSAEDIFFDGDKDGSSNDTKNDSSDDVLNDNSNKSNSTDADSNSDDDWSDLY